MSASLRQTALINLQSLSLIGRCSRRPGGKSADLIVNPACGAGKIDRAKAFIEDRCVAGKVVILRRAQKRTAFEFRKGYLKRLRAQNRKAGLQFVRCFIFTDRRPDLFQHIAGIKPFAHIHGGDAGFSLAV